MTPMQHQSDVVEEVKRRNLLRVLLNWGLGLGKTLAGMLIAENWGDDVKIIVCPKSLVGMWTSFLQEETPLPVTDLTSEKMKNGPGDNPKGWYVINYDLLQRRPWIKEFASGATIILDESSYIKHLQANRTRIVLGMSKQASHIAMLSGTPCGGKWEDMWTHAYLLGRYMPVKDYKDAFLNMYTLPLKDKNGKPMDIEVLNKRNPYKMDNIRNILIPDLEEKGMFTLKTSDCLTLPEVTDSTITVGMPREYLKFVKEKKVEVSGALFEGDSIMSMRQGLRRLASSCNAEKLEAVEDLLNSTDERVVIFYQYKKDFEKLGEICRKLKKPVVAVNGDRNDLKKENNAYETKDNSVCLIQWQSGGYGLNLQKAHVGVFFSLTESYELYEQARGRIHRNGQQQPVIYYNIVAKGTIDEKIAKALARREDYDDKKFVADFPQFSDLPSGEPEKVQRTASASLGKAISRKMNEIQRPAMQPTLFDII